MTQNPPRTELVVFALWKQAVTLCGVEPSQCYTVKGEVCWIRFFHGYFGSTKHFSRLTILPPMLTYSYSCRYHGSCSQSPAFTAWFVMSCREHPRESLFSQRTRTRALRVAWYVCQRETAEQRADVDFATTVFWVPLLPATPRPRSQARVREARAVTI